MLVDYDGRSGGCSVVEEGSLGVHRISVLFKPGLLEGGGS